MFFWYIISFIFYKGFNVHRIQCIWQLHYVIIILIIHLLLSSCSWMNRLNNKIMFTFRHIGVCHNCLTPRQYCFLLFDDEHKNALFTKAQIETAERKNALHIKVWHLQSTSNSIENCIQRSSYVIHSPINYTLETS